MEHFPKKNIIYVNYNYEYNSTCVNIVVDLRKHDKVKNISGLNPASKIEDSS